MAREPSNISFLALKQEKEMTAPQLMEVYEKDNFMKQFVPIIKDSDKYPLIVDSNNIICSLPPIINGEHSKVTDSLSGSSRSSGHHNFNLNNFRLRSKRKTYLLK